MFVLCRCRPAMAADRGLINELYNLCVKTIIAASLQKTIMKIYISLLLISFSFIVQGQAITRPKPMAEWKPLYYLDSVLIEPEFYFEPNKIADVQVVSDYYDSTRQIHGKVFLTSKEPKTYRFLGIAAIT